MAAVIEDAAADLLKPSCELSFQSAKRFFYGRQARTALDPGGGSSFRLICEVTGLDPGYLLSQIKRRGGGALQRRLRHGCALPSGVDMTKRRMAKAVREAGSETAGAGLDPVACGAEATAIPIGAGVAVGLVSVTPEMARALLETQGRNRPLNRRTVNFYSRQMAAGKWLVNGETIKLDTAGRLVDGQHRLRAVDEAGVAVALEVRRDLPVEAFETLDTGRKRTAGDLLAICGAKRYNTVAGALRYVFHHGAGTLGAMTSHCRGAANADILRLYEEHPSVIDAVDYVMACRCHKLMRVSMAAGMCYLFRRLDRGAADEFFQRVGTGAGLTHGDPEMLLRDRLIDNKTSIRKDPPRVALALVIKAWNARRNGTALSILKFTPSGPHGEPFPLPE